MNDLSICIVSYQTRDLLRDCLRSIYGTVDSLSFEIIIVDNHSEDGTPEMLRDEFPDVRLLVNDHNTGYTRPNNQALRESKGYYVILLNPDTLVKSNAIVELFSFLETHPEVRRYLTAMGRFRNNVVAVKPVRGMPFVIFQVSPVFSRTTNVLRVT